MTGFMVFYLPMRYLLVLSHKSEINNQVLLEKNSIMAMNNLNVKFFKRN